MSQAIPHPGLSPAQAELTLPIGIGFGDWLGSKVTNSPPRILIACEYSGRVREAFAARGWDAWSCDLLPSEIPTMKHMTGDVLTYIRLAKESGFEWDAMIAHPPCTYLSSSGMHWTTRGLRDPKLTEDALDFVKALMCSTIPHICIENPVGCISTRIRKPCQIIQPYNFGEDASKATCLWLKNLPRLTNTKFVPPRIVGGKHKGWQRWANQTDSGQNKLPPSEKRGLDRAKTYTGIAEAMADQWTRALLPNALPEPSRH